MSSPYDVLQHTAFWVGFTRLMFPRLSWAALRDAWRWRTRRTA